MFDRIVETLKEFKKNGVPKDQALDCLEFEDFDPDMNMLDRALEVAYAN